MLLLAVIALLTLPPLSSANFVYWASAGQTTIGRAKINGSAVNNAFITGLTGVQAVAVDSQHIYWTQGLGATSTIGRANLDGAGANPNFIPHSAGVQDFDPSAIGSAAGIAVNSNAIFWENSGSGTVGKANLDGSSPTGNLVVSGPEPSCGLAADPNFVYWLDTGLAQSVGRARVNGTDRQGSFIGSASNAGSCGLAVDTSFLYWGANPQAIGRAPVGGGTANNAFIPSAVAAANSVCGVAVNSQYAFWGNSGASDFIGRANLTGSGSNPTLIAGPTDPCLPAAAPANKITVTSITKKKKKGTAAIDAKVPGPGQVTLNQTSTPPDTNAVAASVKQVGLTITQASSFKLAVKPKGKTAKKLKKQVKKKGRGNVKVKVFVHFVPAGVAGVPNTKPVTVTLIKQGKKK
jgi:virginiamycin B lyase